MTYESSTNYQNSTENIPADETERQYYYIEKARQIVERKKEELGRPLTSKVVTFGCQMNVS